MTYQLKFASRVFAFGSAFFLRFIYTLFFGRRVDIYRSTEYTSMVAGSNRRQFLKLSGAALATQALAGCASWDRIFTGDSPDDREKVVILGAGLAGLSAALELKKSGLPYRIYEASGRIGGRVYSLENWDGKFQALELGGEWIAQNHGSVLGLARELRVAVQESRFISPIAFQNQDGLWKLERFQSEWKALQRQMSRLSNEIYGKSGERLHVLNQFQFPKAAQLDAISAAELINRIESQISAPMRQWLERLAHLQWGVGLDKISSLHILHWFQNLEGSGIQYKISGGNSNLINALFARISGVIPDKYVKLEHELIQVRRLSDSYLLTFKTGYGEQEILAKNVICTLPPTALRKIRGLSEIGFSAKVMELIRNMGFGTHTKLALGFQDRFWKKNRELLKNQYWMTSSALMSYWESSRAPNLDFEQVKGILVGLVGGENGQSGGPHLLDKAKKDLSKILDQQLAEERSQIYNWSKNPWSEGSVSYHRPGQFILRERLQNTDQSWVLAGEHASSLHQGTMNGAVESGYQAAQPFKAKKLKA